jgi:GT2 family glycosyltransferase
MSSSNAATSVGPRLLIIIPTHNRWEIARLALSRLRESDYTNFEIVLVEDGCTDGTAEKCAAEFPEVKQLHGDGNLWWSGAINLGVKYALSQQADLICWLNDDNFVEPTTLSALVKSHERNGQRSVICSRVRVEGSDEEWIGAPPNWHPEAKDWKDPSLEEGQDLPIRHPPGGQGVVFPIECFREVGMVDALNFPHYWADHDFHYRAMRAGYNYFIATDAVVWNRPNKARPEAAHVSNSFRGAWWFLTNIRSPMNMPTMRRLLKRHLDRSEYRKTFYPLFARHIAWLSYEVLTHKPLVHKPLSVAKRSIIDGRASDDPVR